MTDKDHLRDNSYRSSRTRARKRLQRLEMDELPSFVDPEFDEMEEGAETIVERFRKQAVSD